MLGHEQSSSVGKSLQIARPNRSTFWSACDKPSRVTFRGTRWIGRGDRSRSRAAHRPGNARLQRSGGIGRENQRPPSECRWVGDRARDGSGGAGPRGDHGLWVTGRDERRMPRVPLWRRASAGRSVTRGKRRTIPATPVSLSRAQGGGLAFAGTTRSSSPPPRRACDAGWRAQSNERRCSRGAALRGGIVQRVPLSPRTSRGILPAGSVNSPAARLSQPCVEQIEGGGRSGAWDRLDSLIVGAQR